MPLSPKPVVEPTAVSIADAGRISGLSRSELYRLIGAGRLRAVKHGVRTLIPTDGLYALLDSLPAAKIRTTA